MLNESGAISTTILNDLPGKKAAGRYSDKEVRQVAEQFEAMFTTYMLKVMNESIDRSDLVKRNMGEEIFQDLLNEQYANKAAKTGQMGLSNLIYKTLKNDPSQIAGFQNKIREHNAQKHLTPEIMQATAGNFGGLEKYMRKNEDVETRMKRIDNTINAIAKHHGVDPALVKAVIRQESQGDPYAVSPKGAKGLMQLMDSTATEYGVGNVYNSSENINGGTRYLKQLIDQYNGDLERALAAYNAGPDAVREYNGVPPFPETENYVKRVLEYMNACKAGQNQG